MKIISFFVKKYFYHSIRKSKIIHVKVFFKEMSPTRHLDRSETEWRDLNYCLLASNSISERNKKFLNVSTIHLLILVNKNKYEISTVDCTQIKDLNNLCVRPTIACKQAKLGLDSLHSFHSFRSR